MTTTESTAAAPRRTVLRPIERPRLFEKLDGAGARIIALIAPAGCGKTTLAEQWVRGRKMPYAWYGVGSEGFDVAAVAARVAAAVATLLPAADQRMLTRLSVSTDPEAEAAILGEFLAGEMQSWPTDARLVIDDYQALAVSPACEVFIETLVRETPLRLLVASRNRPAWAGSRLRLYGELFELGRDELRMTPAEAGDFLAPVADEKRRAQLVELCRGWPAVLGLAAHAASLEPPHDLLLEGLYDFFAEELFQNASPDLKRLLCQISSVPRSTRKLLELLGGEAALELAAEAEQAGFFHSDEGEDERSLHPLLRTFLQHRLDERRDRIQLLDELADALLASGLWDDVWQLIHDRNRPDLLPRLIEASLPTLLDGSRLPALETWISFGHEHCLVSPLLDLAEAEVCFLAGEHSKAYALALQATHHFEDSSPLCWRASAIAGRSAHFLDRLDEAIDHLRKARTVAPDDQAIEHCLWTEFVCSYELENDNCASLLSKLRSLQSGRPETLIRVVQGEMYANLLDPAMPLRRPLIEPALAIADRALPQVRTSFLITYCDYLLAIAQYAKADALLRQVSCLLEEYDLGFGYPAVACGRALAAIGLRRYRHASLLLDSVENAPCALDDSTRAYVSVLRDIISLLRKETSMTSYCPRTSNTAFRAHRGLSLSVQALAYACGDDFDAATAYSSLADRTTRHCETRAMTALVRAIIAIRSESPSANSVVDSALRFVSTHEQWNCIVWAYRAFPEFLRYAIRARSYTSQLSDILITADDRRLASRYGFLVPPEVSAHPHGDESLSRREREVLQLVADGLASKDIANRLFISEVTVKVHLRHIYEKLGVHNRTEAALFAVHPD